MYYMIDGFENIVREMVTFELGKKIEKDAFWESSWGIKPWIFRFHTSMLYHWATETL